MIRLRRKPPAPPGDVDAVRAPALERKLIDRLPLFLLVLVLAGALLLNVDRAHFYATPDHDTGLNLAIAENLSPQHNFRLFIRLIIEENGEEGYNFYSRFPIGGFILMRLAIQPFGENLAVQVFAGRMLMLAFYGAAAILAFHAIARIAANRWIALTAVLVAFSSYYILHHTSLVSVERMVDLFAVMLAFHGMVIFVQEGRFRQLLIKTCAALLLGWHVYAFLAPFILLGFASEIAKALNARRNPNSPESQRRSNGDESYSRSTLRAAVRSRYLRLGAVALLFGFAVLAFNILGEYTAANGESDLAELPTVRSMLYRASLDFDLDDGFQWSDFLRGQFTRIVGAAFPYALTNWPGISLEEPPNSPPLWLMMIGVLTASAPLAGLLFVNRHRLLLATLALSGFFWAIPLRRNTFIIHHHHEAIYYVGVPLALATLLLLAAGRFGSARFLQAAAAVALLVFGLSIFGMFATSPEDAEKAARQEAIYSDAENIRKIVQSKGVYVAQDSASRAAFYGYDNALHFYFAGGSIRHLEEGPPNERDFILISHRDETAPLLTPENETMFLYDPVDPDDLRRSWFESVASSDSLEPAARSIYDIFIADGALIYVKEPCADADAERRFFLHVFPERTRGHDNLDFDFHLWGVAFAGACAAKVPLPEYPIAGIRTGQFGPGAGEPWGATFPFNQDARRLAYANAASAEPTVRSEFNIYVDDQARALTYVKAPCGASDVDLPFFLQVTPSRIDDLPPERRGAGFEDWGFDFRLRGVVFDDKCAARVSLPEYEIAGVRTGQWIRGEGEIWAATVPFG